MAKRLSDREAAEIRLLCQLGYSQAEVSRLYEVSESAISLIVNGKSHSKGRKADG